MYFILVNNCQRFYLIIHILKTFAQYIGNSFETFSYLENDQNCDKNLCNDIYLILY